MTFARPLRARQVENSLTPNSSHVEATRSEDLAGRAFGPSRAGES